MSTKAKAEDAKLQVIPPNQALAEIPEHLRGALGSKMGLEEADSSDYIIPRLSICQDGTPQRKKADPGYIQGLEEGDLFNTVSGKIYAKAGEPLLILPLFLHKNRIMFKEPMGSGIECQAPDGIKGTKYGLCENCKYRLFDGEGNPPACTEFRNFVSVNPKDENDVFGMSLKSTSTKMAKQFISQVRLSNLPMFARLLEVRTTSETKNGKTYFQWQLALKDFASKEQFNFGHKLYESLRARGVVVDTTGESDVDNFDTDRM